MKDKYENKKTFISILIAFFLMAIFLLLKLGSNGGTKETDGIKLYYRVHTKSGYSDWYTDGEETNLKSILGIEIKVESDKTGHIIYNTYSSSDNFRDNDSYDGEISGNKKDKIYGIKIGLTDELAKDYEVYYRTYNKKDGWLDYTSNYNISGDNGVDIEKIQIKVLEKKEKIKEGSKSSIGTFE